jgi:localization factor PodJL
VNNRADRSADATPDFASPQPVAAAVQPAASVLQEETPTDQFAAGIEETPAGEPATRPSVVAGPLAPRNVSLEGAAQAGDLTAQYDLALQRLAAGRTQEGVTLLRRAADRDFAMAQYRMAKLYERGEGVTADLATARQWTERAAAGGNRRAMHDLGVYFARGEGAPLDEAAAFRWFRQAAELGVADSQYNLGILYQQGRGVNASASEALFWFLVASRHGDQDASGRATVLEGQLPDTQVQQAQARAQAFRPRASSAVANGEFAQRTYARPAT